MHSLPFADYRHSWIVEANVVDPTAGQMDPSTLDAVQNDGGRHHEIQHEIDRVQPLQSFRLRQRPRESCQDICSRLEYKRQVHGFETTTLVATRPESFPFHSPSSSQFRSVTDSISSPIRDIIISSGTKLPLSMYLFTSLPRTANEIVCLVGCFANGVARVSSSFH